MNLYFFMNIDTRICQNALMCSVLAECNRAEVSIAKMVKMIKARAGIASVKLLRLVKMHAKLKRALHNVSFIEFLMFSLSFWLLQLRR